MKSVIMRYGLYSGGFMVLLFLSSWLIFGHDNYEVQEVIGYLTIIVGLVFVYFGLRKYRDSVNGGRLTFGQGLKIGLLIVLIPSLLVGVLDALYVGVFDPEFMDRYYDYLIEQARERTTPAEFEAELQSLESQKEMFAHPAILGIVMFITVFLIGCIITVISAFILQKKE